MTRVSSIFSQMLQLFSRTEFERAVAEHRAERHASGVDLLGPVRGQAVLPFGWGTVAERDLRRGLAASEGKLRHLGLPDAPKRSTLAYANEHRPWPLYRSFFYHLLAHCRVVAARTGFALKTSC